MRFSTIGIVVAMFATGGYGYVSMFTAAGSPGGGANVVGWPTLVDARHVIQMSEPLLPAFGARNPPSVNVFQAGPTHKTAFLSEGRTRAAAAARKKQFAEDRIPPLPVPARLAREADAIPPAQPASILKMTLAVIEYPPSDAQPVSRSAISTEVPPPQKTASIVVGSIKPAEEHRQDARFDTSARSSLGGPLPPPDFATPVESPAVPAKKPATHNRFVRTATAGMAAELPDLRPLGESLAMVRIRLPALRASHRLRRPSPKLAAANSLPASAEFAEPNSIGNNTQAKKQARTLRAKQRRRRASARRKTRNYRGAGRKYRSYQARRNRVVANQIRRRRQERKRRARYKAFGSAFNECCLYR